MSATRKPAEILLALALVVAALALAAPAGAATGGLAAPAPRTLTVAAKPHHTKELRPPAKVRVGRVALGQKASGGRVLLVAVRYPIQARGREIKARVDARVPGGPGIVSIVKAPVSAGALHKPERRRSFTFVHEFSLDKGLAHEFAREEAEGVRPEVTVRAISVLDVNGDGVPDISSRDTADRSLPLIPLRRPTSDRRDLFGAEPFCGSIPPIRMAPGERQRYPLPTCDRPVGWKVTRRPAHGSAHIAGDELVLHADHSGDPLSVGLDHGPAIETTPELAHTVSVRAIGDSVTAGFGYYSDGSEMSLLDLYECKPTGQVLDDACSSNSTATKDGAKTVPYAPDYGLANDVSWAAQWANTYGITNYENLAVSGSEPTNWAPGGSLYATTEAVEKEDPDYMLMTVGANPILANTLFGLDPMGCALYARIFGEYQACVEEAFAKVHLKEELKALYTDLVDRTDSTIYLMQYHLSIPSSALLYSSTQIAELGALMNRTIAEVAAEVSPTRLQVVTPPHFNAGLDLEPVYPADYECGDILSDPVDGPSVQSTATKIELRTFHPDEFCGSEVGEKPWVISGDTGIHPSAEGYSHMAEKVPAPAPISSPTASRR